MKKRTWLFFVMIIGIMLLCLYFSKCDTGPEPSKVDTIYVSIIDTLVLNTHDTLYVNLIDALFVTDTMFVFETKNDTITVHDTTTVRDTLYLPEWKDGDRMHVSFNYKWDHQARFACRWSTDKDTAETFGMFPDYAPWDAPDSLSHYARNFQYRFEIEGAEYIDTVEVNGKWYETLWKVVNWQLIPYSFFGIPGTPSVPYRYVHTELLGEVEP